MFCLPIAYKALQKKRITSLSLLFALPYCTPAIAQTYQYDALNRLTSTTYATRETIYYTYDAAGNLLQVNVQRGEQSVLEGYITDKQGNPLDGIQVIVADQIFVTDTTGYYQVTDLPSGEYVLWARGNGHNFSPISINLNGASRYDLQSDGITSCLLYAVHDEKRRDSQFFTVSPESPYSAELLGQLHKNYDLESLDIHPETDQLYAVSGNDGEMAGSLYAVNAVTGDVHWIGDTGFNDINGLSFSPDGQLWAWGIGAGLLSIDTQTGQGTLVLAYEGQVEDLTWDNTGDVLYLVQDNQLYGYTPSSQQIISVCNPIAGNEIEALEMLPDGHVLFSQHQDQDLLIRALNIDSCEILSVEISTQLPDITLDDVEGIAWPLKACQ